MIYFEDLEIGAVQESGARTVTEAEIIAFARKFDPQYFHIDPEAAKQSIFGGLIASGWHTAAMMMRLTVDLIQGSATRGSPGFDELRWHKPVRPGDRIRVRITCIEKRESQSNPSVGIVKFRSEVLNQDNEIVLSVINLAMHGRRPSV